MRSFLSVVFCILLPFTFLFSQNNRPLKGQAPAWVVANPIDYKVNLLDKEAEDGSIDLDYEKQVNLNDQSVYVKHCVKILSEAGVQDNSNINIYFDPTFQQLTIHTIEIIRDGILIDKLNLQKIKVIHVETELDKFIYNGQLQATLILDDVRKGDIIQYSYTLKGLNPIFQNKYQDFLLSKFSIPVYNSYYRIIVPLNRSLNIKNSHDTITPLVHVENNNKIYEWHKLNNHAVHAQDQLPDWYDPYSSIVISEFNSWADVSNWALQLFPQNVVLSEALKNKIHAIDSKYESQEEKTAAALRFVQDDIRYMGIELGIHSHKPASPNQVFNQRFGDCKEKSYLLCTMLRSMGITANPVLINATDKKEITNWLPCAIDFDHCTVCVTINNRKYFLDPTIGYQRGPLSTISYPDYQYGLILSDTTTALSPIRPQGKSEESIIEAFTVPEYNKPGYLKVVTNYIGSYADAERNDFNANSNYELQKDYLDFYKGYFDNIKSDSLTYSDNDSTGVFITTEYYSIDSMWVLKENEKTADFSCYVISTLFKKPKELHRTMPIGLDFPVHYKEELNIKLPGSGWNLKESNENINNASFSFIKKSTVYDNRIVIDYDYERFKDNVMPDEADAYLSDLKKINNKQDYQVSLGSDSVVETRSTGSSTTLVNVIVIMIVLISLVVRWTQKRQSY